ncbi:unnamed protein product [Aspergillus oryzae]|nr:unnamed protein product [Aspergillus oryzae]
MTEALPAPKETDSRGALASRALPIPAIVTNLATGSSSSLKRNGSNLTINKDSGSPNEGKPGLLQTSQSFPIGMSSCLDGYIPDEFEIMIPSELSPLDSFHMSMTCGDVKHTTKAHCARNLSPMLMRSLYRVGSIRCSIIPQWQPARYQKEFSIRPGSNRIIGGKKKDQILDDDDDDVSEPDTARMDTAQQIGFFPRFPRPPKYIRVRAHYKKEKTFSRIFVAQELEGADNVSNSSEKDGSSVAGARSSKTTGKAVWALVFSNDGKYLAAAGQDGKVRVWAVITSPEERHESEPEEDGSQDGEELPQLKAPVFKVKPVQVYEGHTGSVLDLSWSKVCLPLAMFDRDIRRESNVTAE